MTAPVPAMAVPATAAALPRPRYATWALVLVGIFCAVGGVVAHTVVGASNDDLRALAVQTTGTVTDVREGGRGLPDQLDVEFPVDGRRTHATVVLGLFSASFEPGQGVTVLYDPGNPERMTIAGVDNRSADWAWLMDLLSFGGPIWGVVGLCGAVGDRRRRLRLCATLRSGPWSPVQIRVGEEDEDGTALVTPDGVLWVAHRNWPDRDRAAWRLPPPTWRNGHGWEYPDAARQAWWVVDGDTAVFSPDQGAPLLLTRRRR